MRSRAQTPVVCFSHLRWSFVFQRPQQILSRLADEREVYYFEEPVFDEDAGAMFIEDHPHDRVTVLRPKMPKANSAGCERTQQHMLWPFLAKRGIVDPILWYYTPMALGFTEHLPHSICVYDCMDELSMFAFAPPAMKERERALFSKADVVFTGGRALYYQKRKHHRNVRCFPSGVDAGHFAPRGLPQPADLAHIGWPRFGFYGVLDERFDTAYLDAVAQLRPHWQFVILGPIVKIDPAALPRRANIHYLLQRSYEDLPAYLQHWDVAMLPFARNDSTRFISPTKTLEYLAAHKPVISTPIADVVDPYAECGLVAIASTPEEFIALGEQALQCGVPQRWHDRVDLMVREHSWDATVAAMSAELNRLALARALG